MDNLNNIPNVGNWGDAASKLNDNFNKVRQAVTTVENTSKNNKGYFTSLSALNTAFPSPKAGLTAYVYGEASSTNYYIYNAVNGAWVASSIEAPSVGVDIAGYTKTGGSTKTTKEIDDTKANHGYTSLGTAKTVKEVDDDLVQLAGEKANHGYASNEVAKTLKQVEDDTSLKMTNLVTNGNFSNGLNDWVLGGEATASVSNNLITITGTGTGNATLTQNIEHEASPNDKIYFKAKRKRNVSENHLFFRIDSRSGGAGTSITISSPLGEYSYDSILRTLPEDFAEGKLRFTYQHYFGSGVSNLGITSEIGNIVVVNLTKTFGAGNEPTKEEFELLLATLGTDYFETVPAQKIMQWQQQTLKQVEDSISQLAGDLNEYVKIDENGKTTLNGEEIDISTIAEKVELSSGGDVESKIKDIDILLDKTKTPIVNYIKNGDFSDGTNGWAAPNATVENNVLKYSGNTSPINASTTTSLETYEGQELIVSFKVKSNIPIPLRLYLRGGSDDTVRIQDSVGEKTSFNYLEVIKRGAGSSGNLRFLLQTTFSGTREFEIELSDVMILDYSELKKSYSLSYLYSLVNKIGYWEDNIGSGLLLEDLRTKVINDNLLLEKKTGVPIYNEIINGNFIDDSFNWVSPESSIEITDDGAIITGKSFNLRIIQNLNVKPVSGKKLFISFDIKTSDIFNGMVIRLDGSSGNFIVENILDDIVLGSTVRITKILTLGESFTGDSLQFQIQGDPGADEIYKSYTIDNVVVVDLDKTEGTPQTLSELNRFVDMAEGHWKGLYKVGPLTLDNYIKINSIPKSSLSNKYVTQRYSHTIPVPHTSDRINYTGVWKDNVRGDAVNGTNVYSSTKGDAISLNFTGDFIGVLLEHSRYGGKAEVFIDGNSQGVVDTYSDASPQYGPYVSFKKKLPMDEHNIRIEVLGEKNEEGLSNNVYFDHFFYNIEKQESVIPQKSGVIFTVDDTRPTTLGRIVPKLAEYGWRGTSYINPGVGMDGRNAWKTYFLKAHDWEVASHSWVHENLALLPIEEARYNIRMAAEWLQANGMDCGHFTAPYNSANADVMKIVKEFHCSRAHSGGIHFDPNNFDVYDIPRYDVSQSVDLEDLKQKLREVKEMDRTIVLYFHGVVDEETTVPPSITITLFNEIVDYMAEIELDVFRMKDFLPLG